MSLDYKVEVFVGRPSKVDLATSHGGTTAATEDGSEPVHADSVSKANDSILSSSPMNIPKQLQQSQQSAPTLSSRTFVLLVALFWGPLVWRNPS
jgi:hypothetical protein